VIFNVGLTQTKLYKRILFSDVQIGILSMKALD